ncbi:MAG TPA: SCP2 sterol-binding domain-containing protein [Saprospiraceae bacterium]|nr:SCP2 sterol-binding domain-containing protein [Saprospiraceae bacterium]HMQ84038.1 SCP2 sterol-binding domain-containing protein [Saprospiraceae bacterium]
MDLTEITKQFEQTASKIPSLGKTIKFKLTEGTVFIDSSGDTTVVTNEDKEADCTITTSLATINALRKGEMNPMMAMMSGKIKISGDMGLAMKLSSLIS